MRIGARRLVIGLLALAGLLAFGPPAVARSLARHEAPTPDWVGTWGASIQPDSKTTLVDQTVRNIIHTSVGGRGVSLW
jgi:hypothetical protein